MNEAKAYDKVANFYDALTSSVEWFVSKNRKKILRLTKGLTLEVGVGTGNSFKDYPIRNQIVAVDVSREMLRRAKNKLEGLVGVVELVLSDIQNLPFEDNVFETIFASLVLCAVADPVHGLMEMRRVIAENGKLLMVEHVRSKNRLWGFLMDKLNPLVTPLDNINRDTVENLKKTVWMVAEKNLVYDVVKSIVAEKSHSCY